jgi:preprotein translocase subunit SecF
MSRMSDLGNKLYSGEVSYDFVRRRKIWYLASAAVLAISLTSLLVRGLHPSIEFSGGAVFETPANGHSVSDARAAVASEGVDPHVVQKVGQGRIRVQTGSLETQKADQVQTALADRLGIAEDRVNVSQVGPIWGGQITRKAIKSLAIFLVLLFVVLSIRYEPKMAMSAFVALVHDILITAGIYSLVGFEVSPATVIALLTILGYSLYDTVVVFDKVRENTAGLAGGSRMTYSSAANLALNQTLVRSINTTIIALMPVGALLFIGAGLLGAGTLKDLALALFIGLASGAYSSIFVATPLLCDLKEREPQMRALARRVEGRRAAAREPVPAGAIAAPSVPAAPSAAPAGAGAGAGSVSVDAAALAPRGRPPARKPAPRGGRPGRPSGKRKR